MPASLVIIHNDSKCMYTYNGDVTELAKALTGCALRNDVVAEAITRAAVEVDIFRQTNRELIHMTKK